MELVDFLWLQGVSMQHWLYVGCAVCSDDINNAGRACTLFAQYLQSYQPLSSGSANVAQCYAALTVCSGHWQCGECFARLPFSSHCSRASNEGSQIFHKHDVAPY